MGRPGSSSKRKSSKKKSSKISSEARRRKKSRRNISKKSRRRDDSYSDDESASSISLLPSSCEGDYKSRRARSRMRSNIKGSRKRARRSSSGRESSEDLPLARNRKGSKRNRDSEVRKKIQKKKPRRDASISSTSSDSRSCSTCGGGNASSSGESEFERLRGRSRENKKDKRHPSKARTGIKRSENRSRSCSSHSMCGGGSSGNHSKEKVAGEINSRRLRSVITVTKQPQEKEEIEQDKDEHTEEIDYDRDDYPSCKSNDSNDGGPKRELVRHSHVESEKRIRVESVMGEETFVSNLATNQSIVHGKDNSDQYEPSSHTDGVGTNNPKKENESDVSSGGNLESILRQKALENLRRFRGGPQINTPLDQENKSDSNVKQLSTAKDEFVENKLPKKDDSSVVGATQLADQNRRSTLTRDSFRPVQTEAKIPDGRYSGTESGAAKQSVVCLPDKVAISGNLTEKDHTIACAVNKSKSSISALRPESSGTGSTLKQAPASQASPKATSLVTKSIGNKSAAETSQTGGDNNSNNHSIGVIDACGSTAPEPLSCTKPTSEERSSREQQGEAKDSSQFEQKTMSVMRGGEMVQVSYKVYIPKKVPALARRQLRR